MLYFVVYSITHGDYFVVPGNWIYDFNLQSCLNYSINPHHEYICFWCDNLDSLPNFEAEMADTLAIGKTSRHEGEDFPPPGGERCYRVNIKRCFSKYYIPLK